MDNYKKEISQFIDHTVRYINKSILNIDNLYIAVTTIVNCRGKVITTGMGKNGHVAKKVSSTFCSLNIPSCFLHAGESMHGDSGLLSTDDVLIVFSTSGKTEEIINLVQIAKKIGVDSIISITSHFDSKIKQFSNIVIDIGQIEEAGHLNIAPTTSTTIMMIVGDLLATLSAKQKETTYLDFNIRHHSGYLAQKSMEHHLREN